MTVQDGRIRKMKTGGGQLIWGAAKPLRRMLRIVLERHFIVDGASCSVPHEPPIRNEAGCFVYIENPAMYITGLFIYILNPCDRFCSEHLLRFQLSEYAFNHLLNILHGRVSIENFVPSGPHQFLRRHIKKIGFYFKGS